jgi:LuxR family maltose regulon positive regulatory protein
LISAPAGFGKTTLVSDWVSKVGLPAAWITLDSGDNEPLRFLSYVIASLNQVNKSIGRGLLELVPGSQVPSIDSNLMELINQIASTSGICLLVFDDYQVIEEPEIHRIVEYLIEHMPPQLHLILITRGVPLLPIARMRGRGQITELRQEDLRFSREEVTDFLNKVMNLNLSDDDIRELAHRTEGWIAGLLMTALVLQDEVSQNQGGRRREFINSIDERNRYILDYLLQEVFQRQSRAIQLFLLYTSILDRMCSSLCDAITGDMLEDYQTIIPKIIPSERLNSQQILEYLDQSNLFVVPLDRQKEWYRYHRLFADVLRSRLLREQPDVIRLLNERACHWYEKNGYMDLAINHALEGDDFQRAATLIEGIAVHILSRGEMNTLLKWLNLIPDNVMNDHPLLLIYHSWILFIRGQPIDIIEARLGQAQLSDPNKLIAGELLMFNGILAGVKGDIEKSIELSRSALSIIDEGNYFFKGVTIRNLASSYEDAGDLPAAISTLDQSVTMDIRVGNIIGAVVGLSRLAGLRKVQGRLREAEDLYKKALQIVDAGGGKVLPVAGRAMIGLGELYRDRNQLE